MSLTHWRCPCWGSDYRGMAGPLLPITDACPHCGTEPPHDAPLEDLRHLATGLRATGRPKGKKAPGGRRVRLSPDERYERRKAQWRDYYARKQAALPPRVPEVRHCLDCPATWETNRYNGKKERCEPCAYRHKLAEIKRRNAGYRHRAKLAAISATYPARRSPLTRKAGT